MDAFQTGVNAAFDLNGTVIEVEQFRSISDAIRSDFRRAGGDLRRGAFKVRYEKQHELFEEAE